MPETNMEIGIEVTTTGTEEIQKVNKEFDKMQKSTDSTSTAVTKHDDAMRLWNTSLQKQIPAMQLVNPLLSSFNLGMLTSVGAMGLVGVGVMELVQAQLALSGGIVGAGAAMNEQTIGPMMSYEQIQLRLAQDAVKTGISMGDLAAGLKAVNPSITDQTTRFQILTDAEKIHRDTGMSVVDAVKKLSDAYAGDLPIREKVTGQLLLGNAALQQEKENLEAGANATGQLTAAFKDLFNRFIEGDPQWVIEKERMKSMPTDADNAAAGIKRLTDAWSSLANAMRNALSKVKIGAWTPFAGLGTSAYMQSLGFASGSPEAAYEESEASATMPIGMQHGGTVNRSGMALVGEKGPERLYLPRGAQVSPLGGGGITVNVYPQNLVSTTRDLVSQITEALDTNLRNRGTF